MRILNYLNEEKQPLEDWLSDRISHRFLQECKRANQFLYRGYKSGIETVEEYFPTLKNREPIAMSESVKKAMDRVFIKKFGWPMRNGVFTTGSDEHVSFFGAKSYLFFPSDDKYKFLWSPKVEDVNWDDDFQKVGYVDNDELERKIEEFIRIKGYIETNLSTAIKMGHEISFNCESYFLVNRKYQQDLYRSWL